MQQTSRLVELKSPLVRLCPIFDGIRNHREDPYNGCSFGRLLHHPHSQLPNAMTPHVHLCLVLHNHQPIGNFEGVFEQAYQDSYLPFMEVFEPYESLQISLHTSGPLMMWLADRHPEYLDRLRLLVDAGRIEIVGGPQYEPILTMLPSRDRVGQIHSYSRWLKRNIGVTPGGMWMPERVWESSLTSDVVEAGMLYTVLDDYHFKAAGLNDEDLMSYYLVEDQGRLLRIFPGSEHLRYTIPFRPASETVSYLRDIAERHPGAVMTFGDDGEKFGTWPDTKVHVYEEGWLRSFFDALCENQEWLHTVTMAEAIRRSPAAGKTYLPACSYREMTEWSLPVEAQETLEDVSHALEKSAEWPRLQTFIRGGFWRNFKTKYDETNEMYARMMYVSKRLADAEAAGHDAGVLAEVRDHLYRGQCNCPYWHGAFGGVYLPHLRNAIYEHLIAADTLLSDLDGTLRNPQAAADDFDFDGQQEVRLSNDQMVLWLDPARGGRMYEWDVREIKHNLLATLQRRPEAYHRKVLAGPGAGDGDVASIHDRVVFKQEGLDQCVQYDRYARKSLMDHFFDNDASLETVMSGESAERGDFVDLPFEAKLRRGGDRVQVQMRRDGNAWGIPITLTKAVTIDQDSDTMSAAYLLENLPPGRPLHFAIEWNFAGLPAGADDRYFLDGAGNRLGQLGETVDLKAATSLMLSDRWLDLDVELTCDQESGIWAFPIATVSQSEAGFELVHQSVCVMPHWIVQADANGRWSVRMDVRTRCGKTAEPTLTTRIFPDELSHTHS